MCNLIILTDSELQLVLTVILILVLLVVLKGIRWLIRKTSIPVHTADAKPDPEPKTGLIPGAARHSSMPAPVRFRTFITRSR